jgi:hypothetical protein
MHLKHITTTAIVFALAIATASAAAAGDSRTAPAVLPNPDQQQVTQQPQPAPAPPAVTRAVQPNPDEQPAAENAPAVIVRTSAPSNAFDWGDAGIGAAAALGILAIALAGALTITHRRTRRSARTAG